MPRQKADKITSKASRIKRPGAGPRRVARATTPRGPSQKTTAVILGGSIVESLNRAFDEASRQAIKHALALIPGSMLLGKFLDQLASSPYLESLRKLTLDEFAEAVRSVPARLMGSARPSDRTTVPHSGGKAYNTRTAGGRTRLDTVVESTLRELGEASAQDLRRKIGGTPTQLRGALARLEERKLLTRKGQRRATRYIWKV